VAFDPAQVQIDLDPADLDLNARADQYRPRRRRRLPSREIEALTGCWRSQACTQLSHVQPGPAVGDFAWCEAPANFNNVATMFLGRSAAIWSSVVTATGEFNDETSKNLRLTSFG
jgi:hypothetical protein